MGDARERRGPGSAVHERDAVEEDRRGERAEHEVLDPRLLRAEAPAVERGEHVQRDRQDLEREEHDDQVVRGGHHEHPERREDDQREIFGSFELLAPQVRDRHEQRHRRRDHHDDAEEHAEAVDAHHAAHRGDRPVVADVHPLPCERPRGGEDPGRGDDEPGHRRPRSPPQHRADHHDDERGAPEGDLGRDRQPVDRRRPDRLGHGHHFPPSRPFWSTFAMPGGLGSR